MKRIITIFAAISLFCPFMLNAIAKRVQQIPNGQEFRCANCHISEFGGGQLTPFGMQVRNGYLDNNGDVIWSAALAALDSDGDGATNGEEMQDPNGEWSIGQNNPGDRILVTNPGDNTSVPTSVIDLSSRTENVAVFAEPNPFSINSNISFYLPKTAKVHVSIYDINGNFIANLIEAVLPEGNHFYNWDGITNFGNYAHQGIYFVVISGKGIFGKAKIIKID